MKKNIFITLLVLSLLQFALASGGHDHSKKYSKNPTTAESKINFYFILFFSLFNKKKNMDMVLLLL